VAAEADYLFFRDVLMAALAGYGLAIHAYVGKGAAGLYIPFPFLSLSLVI